MKKLIIAVFIIIMTFTVTSCKSTTGGSTATPSAESNAPTTATAEATASSAGTSPASTEEASASSSADIKTIKLSGKIGDTSIQMSIQIQDGKVAGSYYYDKDKKEIKLDGKIEENRMMIINQYGDDGKAAGKFDGWYSPGVSIKGSWTDAATDVVQDFYLKVINGIPAGAIWAGEWKRMDTDRFNSATLIIFNETKTSFDFQMDAYSGAHTGFINGTAAIDGSLGYFSDTSTGAIMSFVLKSGIIDLTANTAANGQAGAGVEFDGKYTKAALAADTLLSLGYVKNAQQDNAFRTMVGTDYELFLDTADVSAAGIDQDNLGATVTMWWVPGLTGTNESIMMLMPNNKLCAGIIDTERNTIKVYTNASNINSVPATIRTWANSYPALPFEFLNTSKK